jgi:chromosome segregation ATPase
VEEKPAAETPLAQRTEHGTVLDNQQTKKPIIGFERRRIEVQAGIPPDVKTEQEKKPRIGFGAGAEKAKVPHETPRETPQAKKEELVELRPEDSPIEVEEFDAPKKETHPPPPENKSESRRAKIKKLTTEGLHIGKEKNSAGFQRIQKHPLYEKLSDIAKEAAARLYRLAEMDTVDRAKLALDRWGYDYHNKKIIGPKKEIEAYNKKLEEQQKKLAQVKKDAEEMRKAQQLLGKGPELPADFKEANERRQQSFLAEIAKLTNEKNLAEQQLAAIEGRRNIFEIRLNNTFDGVESTIREYLDPLEKQLESERKKQEEILKQIKTTETKLAEFKKQRESLQEQIAKSDVSGVERKGYRADKKEIDEEIKKLGKKLIEQRKESVKTESRVANIDTRAVPLRNKLIAFKKRARQEIKA